MLRLMPRNMSITQGTKGRRINAKKKKQVVKKKKSEQMLPF